MQTEEKYGLLKRWLLLIVGLVTLSFGIAFSIKSDLGTSPISSVPYVISLFTDFSIGNLTIIMHSFFIVIQMLLLRKKFEKVQLLQLPVTIAFGYLIDLCLWLMEGISPLNYLMQWILCIIGILMVSTGIYLQVNSKLVTLAQIGLVVSVCRVLPLKFGNAKIILDVSFVVIATILSLHFMDGLYGIREGTAAAAIFIGLFTRLIHYLLDLRRPPANPNSIDQ
ncbi:MAG: DUF6198 family protein [Peptostreptococcales bacterium]|jgi:uncharacterized membrane protein YczE